MCAIDLEPCEVWSETPRRARKQRPCSACGASIQPGDAYLSHFSIFEGDTLSESMCFACWWTREVFVEAHDRGTPGALFEMLTECAGREERYSPWRELLAGMIKRGRSAVAPDVSGA